LFLTFYCAEICQTSWRWPTGVCQGISCLWSWESI